MTSSKKLICRLHAMRILSWIVPALLGSSLIISYTPAEELGSDDEGSEVEASYTVPAGHAKLITHLGYDYAPTMIDYGNGTQDFWWCGGATARGLPDPTHYKDGADVIYRRRK